MESMIEALQNRNFEKFGSRKNELKRNAQALNTNSQKMNVKQLNLKTVKARNVMIGHMWRNN